VIPLSSTVTFKVPLELKRKMKKYSNKIKWSQELREFVIKKIKELEAKEALERARKIIERTSSVPSGFASRAMREDRDSN